MWLPVRSSQKPQWVRGGIPRIDWSHPLSFGLVYCVIPGSSPYDLTGNAPKLVGDTAAKGPVITPDGVAIPGQGNSTGYYALAPAACKVTTGMSLFWRGAFTNNPATTGALIAGISAADPEASPFISIGLQRATNTGISAWFSNGGTPAVGAATINTSTYGSMHSMALVATGVNGQQVVGYLDTVPTNLVAQSGPLVFTSTSFIGVGGYESQKARDAGCSTNILLLYNRLLSASEVQQLHNDPYGFLIWPEDDIFAMLVGAAAAAPFPRGLPIASDLPSRIRGRSIDLLTSYQSGRQGVVSTFPRGGQSAELPPKGRGRSIDLLTSYQAGSQGAAAQIQNDSIIRWVPIPIPPDLRTWFIPGTAVTSTFKDLAGDLPVTPALGADLGVIFAIAGDLPVTPTLAADVSDVFSLVGDLPVTPALAADVSDIFSLIGDLPVTPAFSADVTVVGSGDLSTGDIPVTPVLAGAILVNFNLSGDLPVTPALSATESTTETFVGDLSPSITFSAGITTSGVTGSAYGLRSYGIGKYSAYTPGFQDLAGDLSPSVSFSATIGSVQSIVGDLSPSVVFGGDFDLNNQKNFNGDLSPLVTFGASLTLSNVALSGDLAPSVVFSAHYDSFQPIVGDLAPSIVLSATLMAAPVWQPVSYPPGDWEEVEPCSG